MRQELSYILKEKTNAKIIWFLRESKRKYSDILKHLKERDSGKVNYHIKKLKAANLIVKKDEYYHLTRKGIKYSLYVDSLQLKEKYPLPVVLVALVKGNKILIAKRCRKPCKGQWGLPGNEILYGESPIESARLEVKHELGMDIKQESLYGVYPTLYSEDQKLLYHVMLFAVKAKISHSKNISITGWATGKITEYKFVSKKQLNALIKNNKIIPSNKQPILDAFKKTKTLKEQIL